MSNFLGTTNKLNTPSIIVPENSFLGTFTHVNSANRIYTLPNSTGHLATVEDEDNRANYSGVVTQPSYTDNGNGSITLGTTTCGLYTDSTGLGKVARYTIAGKTFSSSDLTDNSTSYIYARYNGGSPEVVVTTTRSDLVSNNLTTETPIITLSRHGNEICPIPWSTPGLALSEKLFYWVVDTHRFFRTAGLALSDQGSLAFGVSEGSVRYGISIQSSATFLSTANTTYLYARTGTTWGRSIVTTIDNTYYQGATALVELQDSTRYAVNWIWKVVGPANICHVFLGTGDYTQSEAIAAQLPSDIPDETQRSSIFIGKIIVAKGSTTPLVYSAFDIQYSQAAGSGTVTSVGLALPSNEFDVTGGINPVSTTGTLTGTWKVQTANYCLMGPATGAAAVPTFRALVAADIPGSTVGKAMLALTNPSAISFTRINADNTISSLSATNFRTAIGCEAALGNPSEGGSLLVSSVDGVRSWVPQSSFSFQTHSFNLDSLSTLSYASSSFVKMTGANTFSLDTTVYAPGNLGHQVATDALAIGPGVLTGLSNSSGSSGYPATGGQGLAKDRAAFTSTSCQGSFRLWTSTTVSDKSLYFIKLIDYNSGTPIWNTMKLADDASVVHITDTETITGLKVFQNSSGIRFQDVATDLTNKNGRIMATTYDVTQNPMTAVYTNTLVSSNILALGGGTSAGQAATSGRLYAAAAINTTTGTQIASWDTTGFTVSTGILTSAVSGATPLVIERTGSGQTNANLKFSINPSGTAVSRYLGINSSGTLLYGSSADLAGTGSKVAIEDTATSFTSITLGSSSIPNIVTNSNAGLILFGYTGATYDFSIINPANSAYYMQVPTGTLIPNFPHGITSLSVDSLTATSLGIGNTNATSITLGNSSTTALNINAQTMNFNLANWNNYYISGSSGLYKWYQVGGSTLGSSNQSGFYRITLPKSFLNTMMQIKIRGYDYSSKGAWELLIGGYASNSAGWTNCSCRATGSLPFDRVKFISEDSPNTGRISISCNATAKTFSRTSGSFITDGFTIGQYIQISDSDNISNYLISDVAALTITCAVSGPGTTETAAIRTIGSLQSGTPQILLFPDEQTSAWQYPKIIIEDVTTSHNIANDSLYGGPWTITKSLDSVKAATIANITLSGGAPSTLDGITLSANNRVLVKNQTTSSQNGVYTVTTLGSGSNGTWTRATDSDTTAELSTAWVSVDSGTVNVNKIFVFPTIATLDTSSATPKEMFWADRYGTKNIIPSNSINTVTAPLVFDYQTGTLSLTTTGSNNVVLSTSPVITTPTITTSIVATTDNAATLGNSTHNFSDLYLGSGATVNFANSNVVLTHSSGILTLGTGTLKITTPTNTTTSVVTIDGTQTLTNKTITSPNINEAVALTTTATKLNYLTNATGTTGTNSTNIVFSTSPAFTTSVTGGATFAVFNTTSTTITAFGAATTMTIGGTPTTAVTHNYSTNATAASTTKTVNIGTGAAASSTTNVNIGSANGGTTTINSPVLAATAIDLGNTNLSNYTEGTWTPAFTGLTVVNGTGSATYTGGYIRVGNIVNWWVLIATSGTCTTASSIGSTYINNLPYTAAHNSHCTVVPGSLATENHPGQVSSGTTQANMPTWSATDTDIYISGVLFIV